MTPSLLQFPDPVPTVAPCAREGCPLDRHQVCGYKGCPAKTYTRFDSPVPGLYDVPESGEVVRTDVPPGEIQTEDFDTGWIPCKWGWTRGQAAKWYAGETGCDFIEVRVTVQWLRCVDTYEDGHRISEWADDMWYPCEPTDEGAHKFWRCETR